ncbi:hypothetical protein C2869_11965 [Saccharobesus litoralis]|uniref:STAS/SEC14 domain-containing protein n=1 Tax=Saccharobesus litoralis TaxID=2172099 RepID=A0A2S0VSB6_9ALTE|nr:hypothetical protein [Saccharobesus litoralis]AWB67104.1 hypothetical protein C2869_11965 [Saccharobesus litoralis]
MALPQGEYSIDLDEDVILIRIKGGFSLQHTTQLVTDIKDTVQSFGNQPFSILVNALAFGGALNDSYQVFEELNQWLNTKPMKGKANVMQSLTLKSLSDNRIPSRLEQNLRIFSNESEALEWLHSL